MSASFSRKESIYYWSILFRKLTKSPISFTLSSKLKWSSIYLIK